MSDRVMMALRESDDAEHWEVPPRFPWKAAIAEVVAIQPNLEEVISQPLTLDMHVQDAAFFTELTWEAEPRHFVGIGGVILTYVAIRFSAFGRLVTIWGNVPESPLDETLRGRLEQIVVSAGYTVVPESLLELPYTGRNKFASRIRTWWLRYFDYC